VFLNFRIPELSPGYLLTSEFRWNKCSHLDEDIRKCLRIASTYILHDVNETEAYQLSKRGLFLDSCTSTALSLTFLYMPNCIICPVMLAAEGTTRILVAAGLTATTRGQVEADRYVKKPWHVVSWPIIKSQDTLLKFNERTYGANTCNSDFSAAALCSRRCYPHLRFQSQFFPLNTLHRSFLNIHRHNQSASCWPVPISLHPKVSSVVFPGSVCFFGP
jgi:hypothetical protein